MGNNKSLSIIIVIILIIAPFILRPLFSGFFNHNVDDARQKIEEYLYEKYGEEFVVDQIGTRSSGEDEFYQARVYPESIIGTNKENDDYYYGSATVSKELFGRLGGVGDNYSFVTRNMDMEEYLLPEARNIFGERVLLKVDVKHEVTGDGSWWAGYKSKSLEEMMEKVENEPETNRIMLDLEVYIFDRIDDEEEKEQRREDIFEFVQYLKEEGFFEFLEMRIEFVDERVLAPSFNKFDRKIESSNKTTIELKEENTTVKLPPEKLRKEMSQKLQEEVDRMRDKELQDSMKKLEKDELSYEEISKWNSHYFTWVYSEKMIKERYSSSYEEDSERVRDYNKINDVKMGPNLEYVYIN